MIKMAKTIPLDRLRQISKRRPLRNPDLLESCSGTQEPLGATDVMSVERAVRSKAVSAFSTDER